MRIVDKDLAVNIIDWLTLKKFKYNINWLRSSPLYGVYYLDFKNKDEELLTRLTWGIA